MKRFLVLLGMMAGMATPLVAKAEPPDQVTINGGYPPKWLVHVETVGQGDRQMTYYYTNVVLTGSHMPAVIRRYKGRLQIVSGAPVDGRVITATVGNSLSAVEPALAP